MSSNPFPAGTPGNDPLSSTPLPTSRAPASFHARDDDHVMPFAVEDWTCAAA
jgi:hypothetical protein